MAEPISTQDQYLEIIFANKNKAYGAYVLRRLYERYLSWSTIVGSIFLILATSSPLIYKAIKPKEVEDKRGKQIVNLIDLEAPSIENKEAPPPVEDLKPLKSTIKFLPPVIKPDEQVVDEYLPTVDELKQVDPGSKTQQGDSTGVDFTLTDVIDAPPPVVEEPVKDVKEEAFTFAEEMPTFPGGNEELVTFIVKNTVYPEIAKRAGVEGKVFVSFVVEKNGSVSEAGVVKGIGAGCDEEAVRVVKMMPKWKPGRQNGAPVRVKVSIPVVFKLQ